MNRIKRDLRKRVQKAGVLPGGHSMAGEDVLLLSPGRQVHTAAGGTGSSTGSSFLNFPGISSAKGQHIANEKEDRKGGPRTRSPPVSPSVLVGGVPAYQDC